MEPLAARIRPTRSTKSSGRSALSAREAAPRCGGEETQVLLYPLGSAGNREDDYRAHLRARSRRRTLRTLGGVGGEG